MEVIVPEEQLLLAIGKRGQNVKLASKLVGWHIEVRAEGQGEDALKRAEGLFTKKPEGLDAEVPPPEGTTSEAPSAEGLPAEAPSSDGTDVDAKEGTVVEAKEGEPSVAPSAEGTGAKEGTEVGAKEEGSPTKE